MPTDVRTIVTFSSAAFNTTESKDYFINPNCFGDDLAKWMVQELQIRGLQCEEEPGQEDFGWYVVFMHGETAYCFVIGYRPDDTELGHTWLCELERQAGFFASIFGGRNRGIEQDAVLTVHEILSSNPDIKDIRWHLKKDLEAGNEEGLPAP